jgi:hypothetical protein
VHRLVWLWVKGHYPDSGLTIDHINGDRGDNRFANLRPATNSQQKANCGLRATNTSGYKGVSWDKPSRKWRAKINSNGTEHRLGLFASPEAAYKAYCDAAARLHGDFARVA